MEHRRLIKFGNSSHIISIPKRWIQKNKLKKGDLIYLEENGNNELVLTPIKLDKEELKEIRIEIKNKPISTILREIIHAYLNNYSIIEINGELGKERKQVENLLHNLVALEIVEQTPTKLLVKDFLNIKEVSIEEVIRRMDIIIRSMMTECKNSIKKNRYEEIASMDININKFRFMLQRVIRNALANPDLQKNFNKNPYELFGDNILVMNLESIADECRRIARFLNNAKLNQKEKKNFENIFNDIEKSYLDIMKTYYTNNKESAHSVSSRKDDIIGRCDIFFKENNNKWIGPIAEKLKGMESFIRNIGRVVIDKEPQTGGLDGK